MIQVYIVFFKIFVFLALGFVLNKTKVIDGNAEKAAVHDLKFKPAHVFP